MKDDSKVSHTDFGSRELHLHPFGADQWFGVVYIDGIKCGQTEPMSTMDAVKRHATKRFGEGLKALVWSQDSAMILSEG